MNETINAADASAHRWRSSDDRMRVPDTSMLPAAEAALRERAGQLGDGRDERAAGWRSTVRNHPLSALAAAAVLGAVIARFSR